MTKTVPQKEVLYAGGDHLLLNVDHLHLQRSDHQDIRVLYHPSFGRILRLDEHFQTSERDEFFYHEAMVHPIMFNDLPARVLIVGGGDGGILKQVLKHECVQKVTLVELDQQVIEVTQRFLPGIMGDSLNDERVELIIGDGLLHAAQNTNSYDLIILDLPDPEGRVSKLTEELGLCIFRGALSDKGSLVMHTGSVIFQAMQIKAKLELTKKYFKEVNDYSQYVPLYGSPWGMVMCRKSDRVLEESELIRKRMGRAGDWVHKLKLYNASYHDMLLYTDPMAYWREI